MRRLSHLLNLPRALLLLSLLLLAGCDGTDRIVLGSETNEPYYRQGDQLKRQGRYQEADQNFERAEKVAPNSPRVVFARASIYVETHHNLEVAKQLLKRYMSMDLQPDDPPKSEAAKLLRQAQGG